jgi:hypothetical protein
VNYKHVERTSPTNEWKVRNTQSIKNKEVVEPPFRVIDDSKRKTGFVDFSRQKKREEFYKMQGT